VDTISGRSSLYSSSLSGCVRWYSLRGLCYEIFLAKRWDIFKQYARLADEATYPGNIASSWEASDALRPITVDPQNILPYDCKASGENIKENSFSFGGGGLRGSRIRIVRFSLIVAVAISAVPGFNEADGSYRSWLYDRSELKDAASMNSVDVQVTSGGYGYGSTDRSLRLALAVIMSYCVFAVAYVAYLLITGHTPIAWDSAAEFKLLTLQSKESNDLGHVSVGLDAVEMFRRSVGIRVNIVDIGDGEVKERSELVFEHDEDTGKRPSSKVKRNKAY
jgi:hypothetical protein